MNITDININHSTDMSSDRANVSYRNSSSKAFQRLNEIRFDVKINIRKFVRIQVQIDPCKHQTNINTLQKKMCSNDTFLYSRWFAHKITAALRC